MTLGVLWRITRAPYADLSGEGARRFGGRWNPVGTACIYASATLALAVLEALVHTDPDLVPDDLVAVELDPAGASFEEHDDDALPARWRAEIGHAEIQAYGERWVKEARSALLVLPSVLLPPGATGSERNVVLNPAHPDAGSVRVLRTIPFTSTAAFSSLDGLAVGVRLGVAQKHTAGL